jgi:hypothetical protein
MNDRSQSRRLLRELARPRIMLPFFIASFAVYLALLHPWLMNWGTSIQERQMTLAADEMFPHPAMQFTRAITIHAPAHDVWPWVVQLGQDRAGFYSYDWLENLIGSDIHNADAIHPEWQALAPGDGFNNVSPHYLGGVAGEFTVQRIAAIEPERAIVTADGYLTYALQPIDDHTTRLFLRERDAFSDNLLARLSWDPAHFVMQRQMLRGIKARAEGHPNPPALLDLPARLGWAVAGLAVVALFLVQEKRRWLWLVLPVAAAIPALAFAHDIDAALAAFLAVGITTIGGLAFGRRWWAPFTNLAAVVMLILLFAPDAYIAFGLLFAVVMLAALIALAATHRLSAAVRPGARRVATQAQR